MKLAIVGSRGIRAVNLEDYLPADVTEIVSGGARGVDSLAAAYARAHGIKLTEFLPDYDRYGRGAPLRRNDEIVAYADAGIALWDGKSRGTYYTINKFREMGKPCKVFVITD